MTYIKKTKERFFNKVKKTKTCWNWVGTMGSNGYGQISFKGKYIQAHRLSWILKNRFIPKGKFVLHKCDIPTCVNPKHLFIGTNFDNVHDAIRKGRMNNVGENHGYSKLSNQEVISIRKEYIPRKCSQRFLARKYNVTHGMIYCIVHNKNWKHL